MNIFALYLDERLLKYCKKQGWFYTRYADDLTISTPTHCDIRFKQKSKFFISIITQCGFKVNKKKIRYQQTEMEVTGVMVLKRGKLVTKRKKLKSDLRALVGLHQEKGHDFLLRKARNGDPIEIYHVSKGITEWLYPGPINKKLSIIKHKELNQKFSIYKQEKEKAKKIRRKNKKAKKFTKRELQVLSDELLVLAKFRNLKDF